MAVRLFLGSEDFSPGDLDRVSREFEQDVSQVPGLAISHQPGAGVAGTRGDPVTIGTFLLAMVTSGTVTALFNIIKSYAERGVDFTFEGTSVDGKPLKLQIKGASLGQFHDVLKDVGVLK